MREKTRQASHPESGAGLFAVGSVPDGDGRSGTGALINGAGATPRSGRVSVLARRIVPAAGGLETAGRVVGIGTSEGS